eukprot:CAMPEP_0167748648 /NCGR_PEP_ID=MMETSP0110_2-20121227/4953_1 /TAXON_ID=629695 /ORGANISM="Gymnochlora sp., Strain CCMP2014" /LENGTH=590 /DNA_ID=CAMNT_0007633683 /DNA_START=13 /DNA_END=1786 /DNA_ORIENTATION=+
MAAYQREKHARKCYICLYGQDVTNLVDCHRCGQSVHAYCLTPMLIDIPPKWTCLKCRKGKEASEIGNSKMFDRKEDFFNPDEKTFDEFEHINEDSKPKQRGLPVTNFPKNRSVTKKRKQKQEKLQFSSIENKNLEREDRKRKRTRPLKYNFPKDEYVTEVDNYEPEDREEAALLKKAILNSLATAKRVKPSELPLSPVFRPSPEEFKDPIGYIKKLHAVGMGYGAIHIVPPKTWKPAFAINSKSYTFQTRLQSVHKLQEGLGFPEGRMYTLEKYQQMADAFKSIYDPSDGSKSSLQELEALYWRVVNGRSGDVLVEYGNDIDSSLVGSGFRRDEKSGWNLRNIARLPKSPLRFLGEVKGVTVPWVYCGMLFSSFCWHCEDHHLPSINYLHRGDPKVWYCVPSSEAKKFEDVMHQNLPSLFKKEPDLIHKLCTTLDPGILVANGISVHKIVQTEGTFVVTFPRGYHSGFNTGFNVAEAVNVSYDDWFRFGRECSLRYKIVKKPCVFSHEEILFKWTSLKVSSKRRKDDSCTDAIYTLPAHVLDEIDTTLNKHQDVMIEAIDGGVRFLPNPYDFEEELINAGFAPIIATLLQ